MVTGMQGDRATSALKATRFTDIRWLPETGSTNADALELAAAGAPEGLVVVADHQTAGRGRLARTWEAPPGASLLVSVLLRPDLEPADAHLAVSAMAIAAAEAVAEVAPLHPVLKWPNDLLVMSGAKYDGRKLGGILAEAVIEGDRLGAVVVGLGLNVNWPADLPAEQVRHQLHPVADAKHRHPEGEHARGPQGRTLLVDRRGPAREDDAARPEGPHRGDCRGAGPDLAVDASLADAPGDQLGVLRAEIEDQDPLGVQISGCCP